MCRNDGIKTDPEIPKLLGQVQYYSRIFITIYDTAPSKRNKKHSEVSFT
jgi:hypothetical protein